jgi:ubiquinone/menaquinone biosynthesis C-methylase UbiE
MTTAIYASALDGLNDGAFDRVIAPMTLMDVEDYDGAVREVFRVAKPGGELLMSITHPCFMMRAYFLFLRWAKR